MCIAASSINRAFNAALSFFCRASIICFSSEVNITTCLVSVMILGLRGGFTGSWPGASDASRIEVEKREAKKRINRTLLIDGLIVLKSRPGLPAGFYHIDV